MFEKKASLWSLWEAPKRNPSFPPRPSPRPQTRPAHPLQWEFYLTNIKCSALLNPHFLFRLHSKKRTVNSITFFLHFAFGKHHLTLIFQKPDTLKQLFHCRISLTELNSPCMVLTHHKVAHRNSKPEKFINISSTLLKILRGKFQYKVKKKYAR